MEVTRKVADIICKLGDKNRYFELMAFVANVQEAAIEARSCLTKEQSWDLFTAIHEYKCLLEELANYRHLDVPRNLGIFKEDK